MSRPWDAIVWWERRRIPYNLVLLATALFSFLLIVIASNHFIAREVDLGSPLLGAIVYAVGANLCYTLGWITELLFYSDDPIQPERTRKRIFRLGLIFSILVTLSPALILPLIWLRDRIP